MFNYIDKRHTGTAVRTLDEARLRKRGTVSPTGFSPGRVPHWRRPENGPGGPVPAFHCCYCFG